VEPLQPSATVALLGTGGLSIWALQPAKAGLRVLITSAHEDRLQRAIELGADGVLGYWKIADWARPCIAWRAAAASIACSMSVAATPWRSRFRPCASVAVSR
jgi:D-arabinose 1-dehydrogenase-like Zn-dependent alcohol dehydrogenase